jgi:hypothetical protein
MNPLSHNSAISPRTYSFRFGTLSEHSKPSGDEAIESTKAFGKGNKKADICSNIDEAEAADDSLGDSDNDSTPVYSELHRASSVDLSGAW